MSLTPPDEGELPDYIRHIQDHQDRIEALKDKHDDLAPLIDAALDYVASLEGSE